MFMVYYLAQIRGSWFEFRREKKGIHHSIGTSQKREIIVHYPFKKQQEDERVIIVEEYFSRDMFSTEEVVVVGTSSFYISIVLILFPGLIYLFKLSVGRHHFQ